MVVHPLTRHNVVRAGQLRDAQQPLAFTHLA
jgi:hypothetical protein